MASAHVLGSLILILNCTFVNCLKPFFFFKFGEESILLILAPGHNHLCLNLHALLVLCFNRTPSANVLIPLMQKRRTSQKMPFCCEDGLFSSKEAQGSFSVSVLF